MISREVSAPWHSSQRDKESFKACPLVKAMPGYAGRHRSMQLSDRREWGSATE